VPEVSRDVDSLALADYLRHGYALPPYTLFRGIRTLLPAHTMLVRQNGITTQQYWEIPLEPAREDFDMALKPNRLC